jgi:hypothetical protein
MIAATNGRKKIVSLLLETRRTSLITATVALTPFAGRRSTVELPSSPILIERDADVYAKTNYGPRFLAR